MPPWPIDDLLLIRRHVRQQRSMLRHCLAAFSDSQPSGAGFRIDHSVRLRARVCCPL
jgi:hypothetical protein